MEENNRKMVFMFEHTVSVVHVQHAWHVATSIDITLVQNILLDYIVILLFLSYNFTYIVYLGYGSVV